MSKGTDIHNAIMNQNLVETIKAIEQGSDVDSLDREGRTPIFYASQNGDYAIVVELIARGANLNARDKNLETPLHFAVNAYQPEVAGLLLNSGAAVDAQDIHGNTPLLRAVFDSKGRDGVIKLLLSFGANKALSNKYGVSPKELAKSIGNYDITPFLE